ncbi:MAG: ABC transporter ATP-binding protein, partial [Candidatus Asgardarchaeia archaeon]
MQKEKEYIIRAIDVWKEYRRGKEIVEALKNINLKIEEGEFFIVMGPSGCGKTTLLNVLSSLDKPTRGKVILDGLDLTSIDERILPQIRREKIGFVFQEFNLIQNMTAFENVIAPLLPTKKKKKQIEERGLDVLRAVGLIERKDHFPNQLSGGEQQRVAIARALVTNPRVVFADEPTGNLDSKIGNEIMKLMRSLNREKKITFVVVTHNEAW